MSENELNQPKETGPEGRRTLRDAETKQALISRLNRAEGQIRGIRGMIEKDAYCADVMVQAAAAAGAINSFSRALLESHIRGCVADDLRQGRDETVDELMRMLQNMLK